MNPEHPSIAIARAAAAATPNALHGPSRLAGLLRRPPGLRRWLPWLLLVSVMPFALVMGMALPVLPIRFSLVAFGLVVLVLGVVVMLLLPDKRRVPWKLIHAVFGVAVLTGFLWPNFAYVPIPALPTKNPQRLVWAAAIAYWLYTLSTNRELRERLARRLAQPGLVWLALGLLGWRALSVPFSEYSGYGVFIVVREYFEYLPALMFALTWLRGLGDVRRLARWVTLAMGVVCALALAEYLRGENLFLALVPYDPSNENFLRAVVESKMRGGEYRVQGSFDHPLLLAQFLGVALPLALWLAWTDPSWRMRLFTIATLLVLPAVMWFTRTRTALGLTAFVGALAATLVAIAAVRQPRADGGNLRAAIGLVGLAAVGVAVLAFMVQLAVGRTEEESSSTQVRLLMLERGLDAMIASPLVGDGPGVGGFQAAVIGTGGLVTLDSYWLMLLLESGLPALLMLLAMLAAGSWRLVTAMAHGLDEANLARLSLGLAMLSFALSTAVLGTPHNLPFMYLLIGALVALDDKADARA